MPGQRLHNARGHRLVELFHQDLVGPLSAAKNPARYLYELLDHQEMRLQNRNDHKSIHLSKFHREVLISLAYGLSSLCSTELLPDSFNFEPVKHTKDRLLSMKQLGIVLCRWICAVPSLEFQKDNADFVSSFVQESCRVVHSCSKALSTLIQSEDDPNTQQFLGAVAVVRDGVARAIVDALTQLAKDRSVLDRLQEKPDPSINGKARVLVFYGMLEGLSLADLAPPAFYWPKETRLYVHELLWKAVFPQDPVHEEKFVAALHQLPTRGTPSWTTSSPWLIELRSMCLQVLTNLLIPADALALATQQELSLTGVCSATLYGQNLTSATSTTPLKTSDFSFDRHTPLVDMFAIAPTPRPRNGSSAPLLRVLGQSIAALPSFSGRARHIALDCLGHCGALCPPLRPFLAIRLLSELQHIKAVWFSSSTERAKEEVLAYLSPGPLTALLTTALQACVTSLGDSDASEYLGLHSDTRASKPDDSSSEGSSLEESVEDDSTDHRDATSSGVGERESLLLAFKMLMDTSAHLPSTRVKSWQEKFNTEIGSALCLESFFTLPSMSHFSHLVLGQFVDIVSTMLCLNYSTRSDTLLDGASQRVPDMLRLGSAVREVIGVAELDDCVQLLRNSILDVFQFEMEEFDAMRKADQRTTRLGSHALYQEFIHTETYSFLFRLHRILHTVVTAPVTLWSLDETLWTLSLIRHAVAVVSHPLVTSVATTIISDQLNIVTTLPLRAGQDSVEYRIKAIQVIGILDTLADIAVQAAEVSMLLAFPTSVHFNHCRRFSHLIPCSCFELCCRSTNPVLLRFYEIAMWSTEDCCASGILCKNSFSVLFRPTCHASPIF